MWLSSSLCLLAPKTKLRILKFPHWLWCGAFGALWCLYTIMPSFPSCGLSYPRTHLGSSHVPFHLANTSMCYGWFGARRVLQLTSWLLLLKMDESQVLFPFCTMQQLICMSCFYPAADVCETWGNSASLRPLFLCQIWLKLACMIRIHQCDKAAWQTA